MAQEAPAVPRADAAAAAVSPRPEPVAEQPVARRREAEEPVARPRGAVGVTAAEPAGAAEPRRRVAP